MRNYILTSALCVLIGCSSNKNNDPLSKKVDKHKAVEEFSVFKNILISSHPSLNLYVSTKRFSFLFDSVNHTINSNTTYGELFSKYSFISSQIGCSHTNIELDEETYNDIYYRPLFFPYHVILVENKLMVNVINTDLPEGTEILNINGKSVSDILMQLNKYEPIEGNQRKTQQILAAQEFALDYFYCFGGSEKFNILIKDTAGFESIHRVTAATLNKNETDYSEYPYYYNANECNYTLTIDEEKKYALLRLNTFAFESNEKYTAYTNFLKNSFELLYLKKYINTLIIDVRDNRGGYLYNGFLLYSYIAKNDLKEYKAVRTLIKQIPYPEYLSGSFANEKESSINAELITDYETSKRGNYYYMHDSLNSTWHPDKHAFNGNVYLVSNSNVVSTASFFGVLLQAEKRGEVVGEETNGGGYSGNGFEILTYVLPYSKFTLSFPYAHIIYNKNIPKNTGTGLIPDYYKPDTYQSFRDNSDRQILFIKDTLIKK